MARAMPPLALLVAAACCCLLAALAPGARCQSTAPVSVTNERELHYQMFAPGVDYIQVNAPSIAFSDDSLWPTSVTALNKPYLLVEGVSQADGRRPVLDFQYKLSRLQLPAGTTLHFRSVEIYRGENSLPVSFIYNSPGAVVKLERCVAHNQVCAPPIVSAVFSILGLRGQACVVANFCRAPKACYKRAVHVDAFTWATPAFTMAGSTNAGGYSCVFEDTYEVCDNPFSWQCVVEYIQSPLTINYCRATEFARRGIPAPTAEQYASVAPLGSALAGPLSQEQIESLLQKIEANWCAGLPYITPQQAIDEVKKYFNDYSGRRLSA